MLAQTLAESKLGDDPQFRLDFAALSDSVIECKDQKSGLQVTATLSMHVTA